MSLKLNKKKTLKLLLPLHKLKWCLIILNEFLIIKKNKDCFLEIIILEIFN